MNNTARSPSGQAGMSKVRTPLPCESPFVATSVAIILTGISPLRLQIEALNRRIRRYRDDGTLLVHLGDVTRYIAEHPRSRNIIAEPPLPPPIVYSFRLAKRFRRAM